MSNGTTIVLDDDQSIKDFLDVFQESTEDYVFHDLKITGTLSPEDLVDGYNEERMQNSLQRQAKALGVDTDEIANVVITFKAGGEKWIFCPQAVKYNGKWYLESFQSMVSSSLGIPAQASSIEVNSY